MSLMLLDKRNVVKLFCVESPSLVRCKEGNLSFFNIPTSLASSGLLRAWQIIFSMFLIMASCWGFSRRGGGDKIFICLLSPRLDYWEPGGSFSLCFSSWPPSAAVLMDTLWSLWGLPWGGGRGGDKMIICLLSPHLDYWEPGGSFSLCFSSWPPSAAVLMDTLWSLWGLPWGGGRGGDKMIICLLSPHLDYWEPGGSFSLCFSSWPPSAAVLMDTLWSLWGLPWGGGRGGDKMIICLLSPHLDYWEPGGSFSLCFSSWPPSAAVLMDTLWSL